MNNGGNSDQEIVFKPQEDFPFMEEYKKIFAVTDKTIFALGKTIYTDYPLTPDLLVHEIVHLKQQEEVGVKEWVYDFIYYPEKRLEYELEAYITQLNSIRDRNYKAKVLFASATQLSSSLYGNIISYADAFKTLSDGSKATKNKKR